MALFKVWFLLIVKHWLIANVIDLGYSRSRDVRDKLWLPGLVGLMFVEITATLWCLGERLATVFWLIALLEGGVIISTCLFERRARVGTMLQTNLACESALVLFYVLIAFAATS